MKTLIIIFSFNLTFFTVIAQDKGCSCSLYNINDSVFGTRLTGKLYYKKFNDQDVQFYNKWVLGDVFLENNKTVKNEYLRYNGLLDELIWIRKSDYKAVVIDRNLISGFLLNDKDNKPASIFKKVNISDGIFSKENYKFVQVIDEGYLSLYIYRRVQEHRNNAELYRNDLYIFEKGTEIKTFKPNRWKLYKAFHSEKNELKQIIRANNLFPGKEDDLVKLVKIFNKSH